MKRLRNVWSLVGAAALVMAAGACGSNASGPLDASPVRGATIQGTVESSGSATGQAGVASLSGPGSGLTVSVAGTSLSTTTDSGGRFTLAGVPDGTATLRFTGAGVDARLQVSGLADGQVLTLSVQVSGTQAVLAPTAGPTPSPNPGPNPSPTPSPNPTPSPTPSPAPTPSPSPGGEDNVEFRGTIQSVSAPNLTVAGRLVRTNGSTRILDRNNNPVGFSALSAGQTVEVEGNAQSDGSVLAFKIKMEDGAGDDPGDDNGGGDIEFRGAIQSISAPNLTVAGRLVRTSASTEILDDRNNPISFSSLRAGMIVEVEGHAQSDGSVAAKKVKMED